MGWQFAVTAVAWLLVNLPLLRVLFLHGRRDVLPQLFGHAPNQFLFLFLFFPIGAFATLMGWSFLLASDATFNPALRSFIDAWPITLVVGSVLAAIVAALDYNQTVPDFDQLDPDHAHDAVLAERVIWRFLQQKATHERKATHAELLENAAAIATQNGGRALRLSFNADIVMPPVTIDESSAVEATRYLRVISTPTEKEKHAICDSISRVMNAYELAVAVLPGLFLFVGAVVVASMGASNSHAVLNATRWFVLGLTAFGAFAVCRTYNRSEVRFAVGLAPEGLHGEFYSLIVIFVAIVMLIRAYQPSFGTWSEITAYASSFLTGAGYISARFTPRFLRGYIGSGAGWGNLFLAIVIIVMCVFAGCFGILFGTNHV